MLTERMADSAAAASMEREEWRAPDWLLPLESALNKVREALGTHQSKRGVQRLQIETPRRSFHFLISVLSDPAARRSRPPLSGPRPSNDPEMRVSRWAAMALISNFPCNSREHPLTATVPNVRQGSLATFS